MTTLDHYLLDAVRIGLSACVAGRPRRHPDSSRQRKTRQRDVTRYEVRRMKEQQPTYLPKLPLYGANHTLRSINARQEPWRSSYVRTRTA